MTLKNLFTHAATLITVVAVLAATFTSAQDEVDFVKDIKPIFEQHCVVCHGPVEQEDQENDFRIDDREDALDWIGDGPADESDLFMLMVSDDEEEIMPPPEHGKLTKKQVTLVKTWIDAGSDWPEDVELVDTSSKTATETPPETAAEVKTNDATKPKKKAPAELTTDEKTTQIFRAIGSLHPAAVHLPIGLLLASGLFALFSLRGNFVMSDCAYYCLWLGTLGAIMACLSGWWYSDMEHRGAVTALADMWDQNQPVFWHRTGGLIITAIALLLALFAAGARNRDPDDGVAWKLGLILLACGIGWVGHTGGELAYPGQYKDLNAIYNRIIGAEDAAAPEKAVQDPAADSTTNIDDEVGKSSGESED